jgi:predicted aconitase
MAAHVRNNSRGEILIKIQQMFLQVFETGALGEVVGKLIEKAEPIRTILPVSETEALQSLSF